MPPELPRKHQRKHQHESERCADHAAFFAGRISTRWESSSPTRRCTMSWTRGLGSVLGTWATISTENHSTKSVLSNTGLWKPPRIRAMSASVLAFALGHDPTFSMGAEYSQRAGPFKVPTTIRADYGL